MRAVQLDPVDLRGLPRIASNQTEWVPPKFLPTDGKGILFLDELTSAPQMTQAGCYQLVLDRKLGEYVLQMCIRDSCNPRRARKQLRNLHSAPAFMGEALHYHSVGPARCR